MTLSLLQCPRRITLSLGALLIAITQVACTSYLPIVEADESLFEDEWSFKSERELVGFRPGSPLKLSIEDAVFMALENNGDLRIRRLEPAIAGTFEQIERARFDPVLGAEISTSQERTERFPDELTAPITDFREGLNSCIACGRASPSPRHCYAVAVAPPTSPISSKPASTSRPRSMNSAPSPKV